MNPRFEFQDTDSFAQGLDVNDPIKEFRDEFLFPRSPNGEDCIYLAGNSLGLQPKKAREYVLQELSDWEKWGVEGHFEAKNPWLPYHEFLTAPVARLVGAQPIEVVTMNSLTVNLHLMMVSFYRPTPERSKILIEGGAFPSDRYAVLSQIKFHGYDPQSALIELTPKKGEDTLQKEEILSKIDEHGDLIALIMLGNVNYLTGQAFDIQAIAEAAQKKGCFVGFDLAHGAGNLFLRLHDWGVDFAVWCNYKYINAGPGAIAGCFVHEKHSRSFDIPRFSGWWGHDKESRFKMGPDYLAIPGAEGWQLSNPPILQLAALRSSMEVFDRAGMGRLRRKSELLTGYLEFLLRKDPSIQIITPADPAQRGAQLSLRFKKDPRTLLDHFKKKGIICDFREPDVIRAAPAPLYTRFMDVRRFATIVGEKS